MEARLIILADTEYFLFPHKASFLTGPSAYLGKACWSACVALRWMGKELAFGVQETWNGKMERALLWDANTHF